MEIIVSAIAREGASGCYTPQTLWPAAHPVRVEVVDAEDDPPCDRRTKATPGVIAFDGYKIGRKTLAMLRNVPGITIQGTDAANAVDVATKYAEAEKAWTKERAEMKGQIEALGAEVAKLRPLESANKEAEQTIADLRARLSRPAAPPQQPQPQQGKQQDQPRR